MNGSDLAAGPKRQRNQTATKTIHTKPLTNCQEPDMMPPMRTNYEMKTEENTEPDPTVYNDVEFLQAIAEIGVAVQEAMRFALNIKGVHAGEFYLGDTPVYYAGEVIGYFRQEDNWVNYHAAKRIEDEAS